MKSTEWFVLLAIVYVAPHLPREFCFIASGIMMLIAALFGLGVLPQ